MKVEKNQQAFENAAMNYMGCEGGDPESKIWLCAMEDGGGYDNKAELYSCISEANQDRNIRDKKNVWANMVLYAHGCRFASLVAAINKKSIRRPNGVHFTKFKHFNENQRAEAEHILGSIFKLNLYPLSFSSLSSFSTNDNRSIKGALNFNNKNEYYKWCDENRRSSLTALFSDYTPDVVICAGLGKENEFISGLFRGAEKFEDKSFCGGKKRYVRYKHGNTNIFIVPALTGGAGSLNSYDSVEEMGEIISKFIS